MRREISQVAIAPNSAIAYVEVSATLRDKKSTTKINTKASAVGIRLRILWQPPIFYNKAKQQERYKTFATAFSASYERCTDLNPATGVSSKLTMQA